MATRITDLRTHEGDYASLDDRMLVLDFQAGQPEAFVEIHRRYGPLARHVCTRFLPNRQDADDAFQETMIRVFQGLHRFNGRYALQPWVARIATNVSLDQIRTRTRRPQVQDDSIEDHERRDPAEGPEEIFERLVERDLVLSVMAGLPESHRTALVLRELEGRSHREIAQALEITPAQAKALIHRAKGSFRRSWLLAITEKGGIAGFAVIPLLWLARAADGIRKIVDRVGGHATQVAQAATPEIVSSAASSPTVVTAASSISERVVAAGMTLLVAGGVTVGAATIVKHRADKDAGDRAAVVSVAPPVVQTSSPEASAGKARTEEPDPALVVLPEPETDSEEVADDSADVGDPSVDEGVIPSPTIEPTPPPTDPPPDETPPPVPVVPAWSGSFSINWASEDTCGCGDALSLTSSTVTGDGLLGAEGILSVSQVFEGPATDGEGDAAWLVSAAQLSAELTGGSGTADMTFALEHGKASTTFLARGDVSLVTGSLESGALVYTITGSYSAIGVVDDSPIATSGAVQVHLTVWSDGSTVLATDVALFP